MPSSGQNHADKEQSISSTYMYMFLSEIIIRTSTIQYHIYRVYTICYFIYLY